MENQNEDQQKAVNQLYEYTAVLLINDKKTAEETKVELKKQGLDDEQATIVVTNLEQQIKVAKKEQANKDMLYGALWCIGGIVATAADIGFIFWGAILFGGIQFFKGLFKL